MSASHLFEADRREPIGLSTRAGVAPKVFDSARCVNFEYSSRGDRVPGRLFLPPDSSSAVPLILLQHGLGGSKESPYMEASAPWVRGGAAVASIDFPLHGERRSGKLSERLVRDIDFGARRKAGDAAPDAPVPLWEEFARQAVLDLRRELDALATLSEIDAKRVAYAGFSLGGMLGSLFCGIDHRPCAAALALAGGGFGPSHLDPCQLIPGMAPRPVLFVNATRDERVPRRASEALFDAAGDPKSIEWFDSGHSDLPGIALKRMWTFLRDHLGLVG